MRRACSDGVVQDELYSDDDYDSPVRTIDAACVQPWQFAFGIVLRVWLASVFVQLRVVLRRKMRSDGRVKWITLENLIKVCACICVYASVCVYACVSMFSIFEQVCMGVVMPEPHVWLCLMLLTPRFPTRLSRCAPSTQQSDRPDTETIPMDHQPRYTNRSSRARVLRDPNLHRLPVWAQPPVQPWPACRHDSPRLTMMRGMYFIRGIPVA